MVTTMRRMPPKGPQTYVAPGGGPGTPTQVRLTPDLRRYVAYRAVLDNVSIGAVIRRALESQLDREEIHADLGEAQLSEADIRQLGAVTPLRDLLSLLSEDSVNKLIAYQREQAGLLVGE